MSDQAGVMFSGDGKPTPLLIARWKAKGGLFPLPVGGSLIEEDRSAKPVLRKLWSVSFPARSAMPFGAIAEADGRFTGPMLNVWL